MADCLEAWMRPGRARFLLLIVAIACFLLRRPWGLNEVSKEEAQAHYKGRFSKLLPSGKRDVWPHTLPFCRAGYSAVIHLREVCCYRAARRAQRGIHGHNHIRG